MSSGLFKNVIYKISLEIMYAWIFTYSSFGVCVSVFSCSVSNLFLNAITYLSLISRYISAILYDLRLNYNINTETSV